MRNSIRHAQQQVNDSEHASQPQVKATSNVAKKPRVD
jgi:hypothetical protein